jgi:hypothetical protein
MGVSLELLVVGIILTVILFAAYIKGIIKGAVGFAVIAIGFLFIILAFDPMQDMVLLWILSMDIGVICAGLSKNVMPRLWILIGLLGMFLTFILLMMRTGFLG